MDKNKIKSFAIWARKNLISVVSARANRIGVTENKILDAEAVQGGFKLEDSDEIFKLSKVHRDKLVKEINQKGYKQVIEEVSYTWFNRFMGIRYMEVNDYIPSGIRVLSSEVEGKTEPDVLTRVSEVIDELGLNPEYIYPLLDSGKGEDREEAYKHILVKQCNELGKIIPQMFEKISDYTELLLPDNLLEEGSIIRKMVEDIEESDFREEVEIIGWMYQYYISEKKDEVFAALKKNVKITKENIPAATQLFTPKWIVKYMVENSLGRLWLEGHPNEELQTQCKYYLKEAEQEPEVEEELKKIREEHSKLTPEDIKILDPCMGSGHILVYAFDVLYEIYKVAGYSERQIPRMILQNNLYGLDIDDRAAQLASFALIMKARHYNRRLFREIEKEKLELNLYSIQESNEISQEVINYFCSSNENTQFEDQALLEVAVDTVSINNKLRADLEYLVKTFIDAKEYGSILEVEKVDFEGLKQRLKEIEQEENFMFGDYRKILLDKLPVMIKQAEIISKKYDICITNPPYASRQNMNDKIIKKTEKIYADSKKDLFSIFIERCIEFTKKDMYLSMITMQSWLFLSSYTNLRKKIIDNVTFKNLLQIGYNSFPGMNSQIAHATSFIILNRSNYRYKPLFFDLNNSSITADKGNVFISNKKENLYYIKEMGKFLNIPNYNLAYWVSDNIVNIFKESENIDVYATPKQGLATGNNDSFVRNWHEVNIAELGIHCSNTDNFHNKNYKYAPYNKGGDYRKWYGNRDNVIKFSKDNYAILEKQGNRLPSREYYFKQGITWSKISTNNFSARYAPEGCVFDSGGATAFPRKEILMYMLGYMCSKVTYELLKIIAPTINFQVGDVKVLPFNICNQSDINSKIIEKVKECVEISKMDYDSIEVSWDFKVHPLVKLLDKGQKLSLSAIFRIWETECEEAFEQLKANEEELNKIFIDIYGLQDELTPEVEDKDITIRKADRERDIKTFISYAVGCMFGRYSIDSEGLIYAGGEWEDKWKIDNEELTVEKGKGKVRKITKDEDGNVTEDTWVDTTFLPDRDNVIPITEDEYFEDDIVVRFIKFVRTIYGEQTLEENLDFIADSIGRKASETARQAIRRYFIKDFYKNHLKVYQKRPIYWMFESGKNNGFKALIYMHRYNEQTVAKVRTDYLHTLQRKYEAEMERQQLIVDSEEYTTKDKAVAKKKITKIAKQIEECREYDQIVAHLANERIAIDLDDGVKVNYAKFQGVNIINSKGKEVKMNLLSKI